MLRNKVQLLLKIIILMQSVFNNIINDSFPGLPVLSQVLTPRTKAAEVILTINLLNLDQTTESITIFTQISLILE